MIPGESADALLSTIEFGWQSDNRVSQDYINLGGNFRKNIRTGSKYRRKMVTIRRNRLRDSARNFSGDRIA
jgi:hypothetical protein